MDPMTPLPMAGLPSLDGSSIDEPAPVAVGDVEHVSIAHLSGIQKAAILVQALVHEGAELNLEYLPEELQMRLIRRVGDLGPTDQPTVEAVKAEFAEKLKKTGLSGASGMKRALDLLGNSLSTGLAQRLRSQTGSMLLGDPWERIGEKEADELLAIMDQESLEVSALILSKLSVAKAAELLGMMPGERARKITYAISLTTAITPDVTKRVGRALAGMLAIQPPRAFDDGPVERVGAILNYSRASTRDDVLEGLDESDKSFAEEVRRAIFTFGNIPERLDPRDISKVVRQVDQDVLVKALAAAMPTDLQTVADFLLGGLSQRMADAIRGEIEDLGAVEEEAGEEAMGEVVAGIRELEANGEVHLIVPDNDDS